MAGDLAVVECGFGEGDGFGREADGGAYVVEADEVPDVEEEGFGSPVDVVAGGAAEGQVGGREFVVDEGGGDGLVRGEGEGEEAAAKGQGGSVTDRGGAFREEDDGEAIAEALRHAFGGLGDVAADVAIDVDGSGHHADPAEDGGGTELDFGDEDAGASGIVDGDVGVGEVVGDDGAAGGDGADGRDRDVMEAKQAMADAAEPGGALGAGSRAGDEDFEDGVGEDGGEGRQAIETAKRAGKRQAGIPRGSLRERNRDAGLSVPKWPGGAQRICWRCGESLAAMDCDTGDGPAEDGRRSG